MTRRSATRRPTVWRRSSAERTSTCRARARRPRIRYLAANTPFFFAADGTPTGGFFWDGRARTFAEQATEPFVNPFEMANADKAAVVAKLAAAPYAGDFKKLHGDDVFGDVEGAYLRLSLAVQQYEREGTEFNAYSSKYDAFLRGSATLSDQEMRGLALYNSPIKGNCAACHPSAQASTARRRSSPTSATTTSACRATPS